MRTESTGETILQVDCVTKRLGTGAAAVTAVAEIDLSVRRGEMLLVMGPSGSGKTTLLTIMGGILKPTSGRVKINGTDITSMTESQLTKIRQKEVGFVFQSFNLIEYLSTIENVEIALNFAGISGRRARKRATELLTDLGLGDRLHFKSGDLSGGERQRVSIARAIANNPCLILADEPTANLDSKHGHQVVALLRDLAKQQDRCVVIVSHDPRIVDIADRVCWLEDGRLSDHQTLDASSLAQNRLIAPAPTILERPQEREAEEVLVRKAASNGDADASS
ncbi:MAG: ABC transporter ATP-binding protein [Chloroflexi bacterium]|nr:ABC transporter ATP-binding protein [Chloroflexota bacterium]